MSTWRLAKSLGVLRDQVNAAWPNRNKDSDGTIGDTRHQAEHSDHNPDTLGVVCAFDITQDPAHGADMAALAARLQATPHPAQQYIIWDRQIANVDIGNNAWRPYKGSDPHTGHIHISVKHGTSADITHAWDIGGGAVHVADVVPVTPVPVPTPAPAPFQFNFNTLEDIMLYERAGAGEIWATNGIDTLHIFTIGVLNWFLRQGAKFVDEGEGVVQEDVHSNLNNVTPKAPK